MKLRVCLFLVCLAVVAAAALAQNKNDDDAAKKARRDAKRAKQTAVVTAKPSKVRAPGANPFGI